MRKYISGMFLAVLMFVILLPMQAQAENSDEFLIDGTTGTVTIRSQHAAKEKLSSLQFSLEVDSAEDVSVTFEFGEQKAKILEYRYDNKKLNIYMAGTEALFAEGTDLTIGKIVVDNKEADVKVKVVKDSLQYVRGTAVEVMQKVGIPEPVQLGETVEPTPPAEATPTPTAEPTQAPTAEPTPTSAPTAEPPAATAQPTDPPAATAQPTEPPTPTAQPTQSPAPDSPSKGTNSDGNGSSNAEKHKTAPKTGDNTIKVVNSFDETVSLDGVKGWSPVWVLLIAAGAAMLAGVVVFLIRKYTDRER